MNGFLNKAAKVLTMFMCAILLVFVAFIVDAQGPPLEVDLSLLKTADQSSIYVNEDVVFSLQITNNSNTPASGVQVTDSPGAELTFQSYSASVGTFDNNTGIWNVGLLGRTSSEQLDLTFKVTGSGTTTSNSAEITAANRTDPVLENNSSEVTISILNATTSIVANDDYFSTNKNSTLLVYAPGVLSNDSYGLQRSAVDLSVVSTSIVNVDLTLDNDGSLLYVPQEDFVGILEATYELCVPLSGPCDVADILIDVVDVVLPVEPFGFAGEIVGRPVPGSDRATTTIGSDVFINVLENDVGWDSRPVMLSDISLPHYGVAQIVDGGVLYTPTPFFFGTDLFSYTVCDAAKESKCAIGGAEVLIQAEDKPQGYHERDASATHNFISTHSGESVTIDVVFSDGGVMSNDLTKIIKQPEYGRAEVVVGGVAIVYEPHNGFTGPDVFRYQACSVDESCENLEISVFVISPKHSYTTKNEFFVLAPGQSKTFSPVGSGFTESHVESHIDPLFGKLSIENGAGDIIYTAISEVGVYPITDTFAYLVCDGLLEHSSCVEETMKVVISNTPTLVDVKGSKEIYCGVLSKSFFAEYIKLGKENTPCAVGRLQWFLKVFENYSDLDITTEFDQSTFNAVLDFQKRYTEDILEPWGIDEPTGYVYKTTLKKLNKLYSTPSCTPYLTNFIKQDGDNDPAVVSNLQRFLKYYEGYILLEVNGEFDQSTFNAVLDFQKRYAEDILEPWGIDEPTGRVYKTTVEKINNMACPAP